MHPSYRNLPNSCILKNIWVKEPCTKDSHNKSWLNRIFLNLFCKARSLLISCAHQNQPWYFKVSSLDKWSFGHGAPKKWREFLQKWFWLLLLWTFFAANERRALHQDKTIGEGLNVCKTQKMRSVLLQMVDLRSNQSWSSSLGVPALTF